MNELIATLKRGIEFSQFQSERAATGLAPGVNSADIESRIIGTSPAIRKLIQQIKKLATVRSPLLLQGENGTGKTAVAEVLYAALGNAETQLVRIDCSLSSEAHFREGLLGQNGAGGSWVAQAKGGTLFLQHIQCLPPAVQTELVSVLRNTAHTLRLICTTTEDLEKLVDEGRFHDELFYRVASLPVQIPPLRQRIEDLPLLARHYSARATNPHFDANLVEFTADALSVLTAYHWPGNLTELFQVISKIAATTETRIVTSEQLPLRLREIQHWPSLADYLAGQERQYVEIVVYACRGDKPRAAAVLGIAVEKLG